MQQAFTVAVTGDSLINRRISVISDERFLTLVKVIRDADIGFTHLETLIHDYEGPEIYPAAEAGWTWMRSPRFTPEELKWAGFDMVSHAGNHSLDYSYGGLYSTLKALDEAGLVCAGSGRNLGDARAPAYLETPKGRVALISMCSSFAGWARAGDTRPDSSGRPGVNPLRFYYQVDPKTMELVKGLFVNLGFTVRLQGKMLLVNPPGLNLTLTRFEQGDQPGVTTVADEDDADGNLRAIKDARRQADWVIAHLHSHWTFHDADKGYPISAHFIPGFARACIDAGADLFIENGGAGTPRGIEVYKNKPIIYSPGELFIMGHTVTRLPADFYTRWGNPEEVRSPKATPADAYDARANVRVGIKPVGGISAAGPRGIVAVCSFGEGNQLKGITAFPFSIIESPRPVSGVPVFEDNDKGGKTIEHLARVSSPFGTKIEFKDGIGVVKL